jgi:hypothetical protein
LRVPGVPCDGVHAPTPVAGQNVEKYRSVSVPHVHITIFVACASRGRGSRQWIKMEEGLQNSCTFAAADYKVAVNASKTAANYVPSLSLTRILAGETPRE